MFSQVKAFVQQMLGPAYDYVMPLVGILIPFRYPGNFYWLFCLSTLAIALVLYIRSETDEKGRTLSGFWRFLAPREVYVTRSAWVDGQYDISGVYLGVEAQIGASGIRAVVETPLTDAELADLKTAAEAVRAKQADVAHL